MLPSPKLWPVGNRRRIALGLLTGTLITAAMLVPGGASGRVTARAAYAQQCGDPYPAQRDPANPLLLPTAPGPNPLSGARLFVDGPRHGAAARAIAQLLGVDPDSYPDSYSWARFQNDLDAGRFHARIAGNRVLAYKVHLLEKIASEPETQRFSLYSAGGGPGAIFAQVQKIFCHNSTADPGSVMVFATYFLYQAGYCETSGQILAHRATFRRQVDELAAAIARRPAVALLEEDGIGSSSCMLAKHSLGLWEANIRYEVDAISALPHAVVYVEAGYSDAEGPAYTANALRAVDVRKTRGFFTNDTHNNWTINEINWGNKIVGLLHGGHFIVNTANNGRGPLRPRNTVTQGNEVLCNAPGRALGRRPATSTGFSSVDAFLWTGVPGNSTGTCNGGPPAGTFWPDRGIGEASRANGQLGPGMPSLPY